MSRKVFVALKMAGVAGQEKLSGIFRFLGPDHDWDITLVRTAAEFTRERVLEAVEGKFSGFIVSIPGAEAAVAPLAACGVPTVVMDIHDPALSGRADNIAFIRNSSAEIGRAAAHHLMSTGRCRSYAYVHHTSPTDWSVGRHAAYRDALRDNGHWCHELRDPAGLARLERPVGVFAAYDGRGYDVLEWCRKHRLRVPEDAMVIGVDNDTLICENSRPRLTSVQPDFAQEGILAAQLLSEMMASPKARHPAKTHFVGVKSTVRRDSTAEASHAGKLVQRALAYIRMNAKRGIGAKDVVAHLGCSRRLADLRFRELQGTSIGETIIETRLGEVRRLLATTREPIDALSAACGFANANYLKNLFKRRYGTSMREWRNRVQSAASPSRTTS